jgi:hypothetical protein
MYVQPLTPYHARMVANNVDYNWSGTIESRELQFRNGSKRLVDTDRNGRVTTEELAHSLMRGDIYIHDRKAYPAYRHGYGHPVRPIFGGSPYGNYQPPYPQAPGYPYQHNPGRSGNLGVTLGATAVGAGVGAGVAYAMAAPLATGAAVGAAIGLVGSFLFNR